jgi:hypothetical protein
VIILIITLIGLIGLEQPCGLIGLIGLEQPCGLIGLEQPRLNHLP